MSHLSLAFCEKQVDAGEKEYNCTSMSGKSILVDASAVLAVILEEPEKGSVVKATTGYEAKVPGCLSWEVGNAFSALVKRGRLGAKESLAALKGFEMIPMQELDVDL